MELDEKCRAFLKMLFEKTEGDSSRTVSMFDVGAELDQDREESQQTAEVLMGAEFVEIRSLSGAIAITQQGLDAVNGLDQGPAARHTVLSTAPIMDEAGIKLVERAVSEVKCRCGNIGLQFDDIAELIADLKTIDAQLFSPKPKTAVIREALSAIRGILERAGERDVSAEIGSLLGS